MESCNLAIFRLARREIRAYYDIRRRNIPSSRSKKINNWKHDQRFFLQKNRNARYCEDWQGVTNYATKFPGWDTLKFAFGNETEKQLAYNHVMRFYSGLKSGVVSFIGSSDAAVDVELINKENAKFILAKFKVINKTSLKSALFHLIPDSMNKKIWIQEYRWKELFSCCLMPPEERMKRVINEIIPPSLNSFPYNINEVNLTPIGDPFFIPGIR